MADKDLIIFEEDIVKMEALLSKTLKGAEAKCALLVDKDGHMIAKQGFTHSLDTTALSALLAGSFASTKEIARLVGESEFSVLFHQGKKDHIHMSLIGERAIMAIIFDDRTTIGMVRLYSKEVAQELTKIVSAVGTDPDNKSGLDESFADDAGDRLDDIFQE
jgi:predicted regulator of Ras-like GTPase activity (Roadblock/LC7/MglB family)